MTRNPANLRVFHLAHNLVLDVYRLSSRLPTSERFGVTSQIRRAAVSIPTNIVEGCNRGGRKEYERFVAIALGSAAEVSYLLRLVVDLGLLPSGDAEACRECSDHVVRALQNLQRAVVRLD